VIDERRRAGERAGHFLLLGSAHRTLLQQSSESLAGRAAYVDLGPIDALEAKSADYPSLDQLWVRGGFPDSFTAADDLESLRRRKDLIRTYLERNLPLLAPKLPAASIGRVVIENIINAMGVIYQAYFYRTANGAEIDLILVRGGLPDIAIDVKRSSAPTVERGFHTGCDDLGIQKRWVIYPGERAYPKPNGIEVLPLVDALEQLTLKR
jgi:predicted AAA+ superfamily ATPase